MTDLCNHTSVGVVARRGGRILLFQRQKFPLKKAPCAGHVDSWAGIPTGTGAAEAEYYLAEAVKELSEETGLIVRHRDLNLVHTAHYDNACRRETVDGGPPWHLWRVYTVEIGAGQTPRGNGSESKDLAWYTPAELVALPDLEPVWRDMLRQIGMIR